MTTAWPRAKKNATGSATSLIVLAALAICPSSTAFAQHQPRRHFGGSHAGPAYDIKSEAVFTGTVDGVDTAAHPSGREQRPGMTRLRLRTSAGELEVHLAPAAFVAEKGLEIKDGDVLEVTGARVTLDGSAVVLARELKKGDSTWTFRDAGGRPLWLSSQAARRGWGLKRVVLVGALVVKVVALALLLD